MKNLQEMGRKVRQARVARNMSLADLGEQIGIDRTLVSKIENGRYQPTETILQKIIDVFSDNSVLDAAEAPAGSAVDEQWATDIWALSGRPSGPVVSLNNAVNYREIFLMNEQVAGQNVQVDPNRTPVLYSDAVGITSSEFGMVFDFGQRVGATSNANVVARIGISYEHARKLLEVINDELSKNEK